MTLRFIAILAISVAIALLSLPRVNESVVSKTGRELDIAIVGRGHFCVIDPNVGETRYTRSGSLHINENQHLTMLVQGTEWTIEPPVTVPYEWQRIAILPDGRVQALEAGNWTDVGQLQLSLFPRNPPFADPLAVNTTSDSIGSPLISSPGNSSGVIQQGWLESRPSILPILSTRLLLAMLAAVVLWRSTLALNNEV